METYTLLHDLYVFGAPVPTFPEGINATFSTLMQKIPNGAQRAYYGLSSMDADGTISYFAAAEEKFPGEADIYGYQRYCIEKGVYLTVTVHNWRTKTAAIKGVFHEIMQDERADNTKPCVEWYKDDNEMRCMLLTDPVKQLFASADLTAASLMDLLSPLSEAQINVVPFKDSWTAAQLATHVTKSNNAIVQAMDLEGKMPDRKSTERVAELKKIFLDFKTKMNSPEFILPKTGFYEKQNLLAALQKSNDALKAKRTNVNIHEVIEFAAFGQITRLELLYFVLYHTQRHIHQLIKILPFINQQAANPG
ncbi:MAG: DinB family protein [Chitinophagaceae bacterium]